MSALPALLRRLVRIEPGEGPAVAWSFAYFFFLLSSYYLIRPLRDALGLSGSDERLTGLYLGTLVGTLVANPVLGAIVSRYPRRIFLPVVYHFLTANLVLFYFLMSGLVGDRQAEVGRVFFVWASVFNLFAVSVFWGFMADLWRSEQGKRLFGCIGLGGTLGAVTGAAVAGFAATIGPMQLLLVSAALLQCAVVCIRRLARLAPPRGTPGGEEADAPPGHGLWNGIRLVAGSPYLLGICLFLALYSISSTLLYFEQARIVRATFPNAASRTAFFARIDLYVNALTAITQLFFTGRILSRIGVGGALAALPAITVAGFGALAAAPGAAMLVWFQVIRRGAEFAVVRPAREVLFTVVEREEKYTSKNLIDTFVYRGGDALGALLDRALAALALGAGGLAVALVPVAAAWGVLAVRLGAAQRRRAERGTPAG